MKPLIALFQHIGCRLLTMCLPERMKRMMVISSLTAYILRMEELDSDVIKRLNEVFKLCSLDEAMQFPILLNTLLWHNRHIGEVARSLMSDENVTEGKLTVLTQRIKSSVPQWLKYNDAQLHDDVSYLLHHRKDMMLH